MLHKKFISVFISSVMIFTLGGKEVKLTEADEIKNISSEIEENRAFTKVELLELYNDYSFNETVEIVKNQAKTKTFYTSDLKTDEEIKEYSKRYLKDYFNIDLAIEVFYDELSEDRLAEFNYWDHENSYFHPTSIIMNKIMLDRDTHQIERVLIHELVHYALCYYGLAFEDNKELFNKTIYLLGAKSNIHNEFMYLNTRVDIDCCD